MHIGQPVKSESVPPPSHFGQVTICSRGCDSDASPEVDFSRLVFFCFLLFFFFFSLERDRRLLEEELLPLELEQRVFEAATCRAFRAGAFSRSIADDLPLLVLTASLLVAFRVLLAELVLPATTSRSESSPISID